MTIGTPVGGTNLVVSVAATSWNVPYPTSPAAGDQLILRISSSSISAITTPSGWTLVAALTAAGGGSTPQGALYITTATGSESGNLTVTMPSSTGQARIYKVPGVDTTTPQDVTATTVSLTATTAYNIPSLTTVTDGCLIFATAVSNTSGSGTYTPPTLAGGFFADATELLDVNTAVHTDDAYAPQTTAGATGVANFVRSGSVRGVGIMIALRPASGATNVNGDVASTSTATVTTAGVVGAVAAATLAATAAITAAGVVGTSSGATVSETATITAAGTTVSGGTSGATVTETGTIATTGVVGKQTSTTVAATDTVTAAGRVGTATQTALTATATITAAGRVGVTAGASLTATYVVTTAGATTGDHVIADAARLEAVQPETRTTVALTEQRTPTVATENRHPQVPAETRTTSV